MDIYIIKGNAIMGEYSESIHLLDEMEDKPKSYVGLGRKISKNKIGKLEEGNAYGVFQIILDDKGGIPEARKRIKEKVYEYNLKEYLKYKSVVESFSNYDIEKEIKIKDY